MTSLLHAVAEVTRRSVVQFDRVAARFDAVPVVGRNDSLDRAAAARAGDGWLFGKVFDTHVVCVVGHCRAISTTAPRESV